MKREGSLSIPEVEKEIKTQRATDVAFLKDSGTIDLMKQAGAVLLDRSQKAAHPTLSITKVDLREPFPYTNHTPVEAKLIWGELQRTSKTWAWKEVDCSPVKNSEGENVGLEFNMNGKAEIGHDFNRPRLDRIIRSVKKNKLLRVDIASGDLESAVQQAVEQPLVVYESFSPSQYAYPKRNYVPLER